MFASNLNSLKCSSKRFRFALVLNRCTCVRRMTFCDAGEHMLCSQACAWVYEMFSDQDVGGSLWLVKLICERRRNTLMVEATNIDIDRKKTFHLIEISAFSAPTIGILDVSQRTCRQFSTFSSSYLALDLYSAILCCLGLVGTKLRPRTAKNIRVFGKHQQMLGGPGLKTNGRLRCSRARVREHVFVFSWEQI